MKVAELARRHQRIGIDSNVVIYALEGSGPESDAARAIFDLMATGACSGVLRTRSISPALEGSGRRRS